MTLERRKETIERNNTMPTVDLLNQVVFADTPLEAFDALKNIGLMPGCYVRVTDITVKRVPEHKDGVFRVIVEVDLTKPVDPSKPISLVQVET